MALQDDISKGLEGAKEVFAPIAPQSIACAVGTLLVYIGRAEVSAALYSMDRSIVFPAVGSLLAAGAALWAFNEICNTISKQ